MDDAGSWSSPDITDDQFTAAVKLNPSDEAVAKWFAQTAKGSSSRVGSMEPDDAELADRVLPRSRSTSQAQRCRRSFPNRPHSLGRSTRLEKAGQFEKIVGRSQD